MEDNKILVEGTCRLCGKVHSFVADFEGVVAWQSGELIQNALPEVSASDREFLISGICPNCWDDMFGQDCWDEYV